MYNACHHWAALLDICHQISQDTLKGHVSDPHGSEKFFPQKAEAT